MNRVAVAARDGRKPLVGAISRVVPATALLVTGMPSPQVMGHPAVAKPGSGTATGSATPATDQATPWWVPAVLVLAVLLWLGGYAVACWIWPYTNCPRCDGTARIKSPSGRAFRRCKKCKATGRRVRFGRRVFNLVNRKWKDAS